MSLLFETKIHWELENKGFSWFRESWDTLLQCLSGGRHGEGESLMWFHREIQAVGSSSKRGHSGQRLGPPR
jgi:hypothetical protein